MDQAVRHNFMHNCTINPYANLPPTRTDPVGLKRVTFVQLYVFNAFYLYFLRDSKI